MVIPLFEIDIYNLFKRFFYILCICHGMLERRRSPSRNKTLPLMCCLMGAMTILKKS